MPIVTMPDGTNVNFPDDMPSEEIKGLITSKFPNDVPTEEESFGEMLTGHYESARDKLRARGAEFYETQQATEAGEQTGVEAALQIAGKNIVGAGLDVVGEVVGTVAETAWDYAIPDVITEPTEEYAKEVMESDWGKAGLAAMKKGAKAYGEWAAENPRFARNLESITNIAAVAIPVKLKLGGKVKKLVPKLPKLPKLPKPPPGGALEKVVSAGGKAVDAVAVSSTAVRNKVINILKKEGAIIEGELKPDKLPAPIKQIYDKLKAESKTDEEFLEKVEGLITSDKTLAELGGKRVAGLAEAVAVYPAGREIAEEFFEEAVKQAPKQLEDVLAETISGKKDYYKAADEITEIGREKASPHYDEAYAANQSMTSPVIDNILATPSGKKALREAVKDMQNEMALVAKPSKELGEVYRDLAAVGKAKPLAKGESVGAGLKLRTLDYIKRSMDKTINTAQRQGNTGEYQRLLALKRGLVAELDKLDETGAYKKAREVSGDYLSNTAAMEEGTRFLKDRYQEIRQKMAKMGDAEKEAYKIGVIKVLQGRLDDVTDGGNIAAWFTKRSNRDRLDEVLSAKDYNTLLKKAVDTDELFKLKNKVIGGSPTAHRTMAADITSAVDAVLGGVSGLGKGASVIMIGKVVIRKLFGKLNDKQAGEVAKLLFETDTRKKATIAKKLFAQAKKANKPIEQTPQGMKLEAFFSLEKLPDMINNRIGGAAAQQGGARALTKPDATPQGIDDLSYNEQSEQPSEEDVALLKGNPELSQEFDDAFGIGAALEFLNPMGSANAAEIPEDLIADEGRELTAYKDTEGFTTVGSGFNMESGIAKDVWKRAGVKVSFNDVLKGDAAITTEESDNLARASLDIASEDAAQFIPQFDRLSPGRQEAIINLSYQLGYNALSKFTKFKAAMIDKNFRLAAQELVESKWYKQTQKSRTRRVLTQIIEG